MGNAYDCLQEARARASLELYKGACSRAYYAYFDTVRALLATVDVETRSHSGAHNLFSQHFVKNGPFTAQDSRFMSRLFLMRQSSDYDMETQVEWADTEEAIEVTAEFLLQVEAYLKQNGFTA
ncbi:MAG: HEPN domain-containing protein [Bacteroidetes bacterium]|nr:HEPN domain-containing protein [Fibrella sp.]